MGYTHYWRKPEGTQGYIEALPTIKKILKKYKSIIQFEYNDKSAVECNDRRIWFNGKGEDGHETFVFTNAAEDFSFCKTARKPYDIVVCECLLVLKWFIPTLTVTSDGMSGYVSEHEGLEEGRVIEDLEHLDGEWGQAIQNVRDYGVEFTPVCVEIRDEGAYFDWELQRDVDYQTDRANKKALADLTCNELDDIVHEVASQIASDANNNGWQGQVEFLKLVAGLSDEEILNIHANVNG